MGSVATEEVEVKANAAAGKIFLKKYSGDILAKILTDAV